MPERDLSSVSPDVAISNARRAPSLPNNHRGLGYDVREIGDGERILPHRIVERFTRRADGELEPLTAESTKPIAETRTHAGIVKVRRYGFDMP